MNCQFQFLENSLGICCVAVSFVNVRNADFCIGDSFSIIVFFFNKIDVSIIEYFKSELNKNLVVLGLMFILFFIGNYINRNKEITWETIFKKQKRE